MYLVLRFTQFTQKFWSHIFFHAATQWIRIWKLRHEFRIVFALRHVVRNANRSRGIEFRVRRTLVVIRDAVQANDVSFAISFVRFDFVGCGALKRKNNHWFDYWIALRFLSPPSPLPPHRRKKTIEFRNRLWGARI